MWARRALGGGLRRRLLVLRTATRRRNPGAGRAASGMQDVVRGGEVNLSRAIATLQKAGFWVQVLAGEAERSCRVHPARPSRGVVLGAVDSGLRRLQRET